VKTLFKYEEGLITMELEDNSKNTSLHLIAQSGNTALLKLVSDLQADFCVQNYKGETPLHIAVQNNDTNMARLMIQVGGSD
jgi:ankyrin repeat protein